MMKHSFELIWFAVFVPAVATTLSAKPTESNGVKKTAQCYVNNNFFSGPNCKKLEQQMAEIKEEIRAALNENKTGS